MGKPVGKLRLGKPRR